MQVWDDMREAGVEPNSYVYVALINACERSSDWRRALRVFNTMKVCHVYSVKSMDNAQYCAPINAYRMPVSVAVPVFPTEAFSPNLHCYKEQRYLREILVRIRITYSAHERFFTLACRAMSFL